MNARGYEAVPTEDYQGLPEAPVYHGEHDSLGPLYRGGPDRTQYQFNPGYVPTVEVGFGVWG